MLSLRFVDAAQSGPLIGDHVAVELYTRLASDGDQRLGPYSRFGFHHPGPMYFYLSVPFYRLTGERHIGIGLTALVLNALSILTILRAAARGAGASGFFAAAIGLSAFLLSVGPAWLCATWNPSVAVLAFGAAVFSLAAVAAGETRQLPVAALAASFAVQTHLPTAPTLLGLAAAAMLSLVILALRERFGPPADTAAGRRGPWILATAGLLMALWILPALEQSDPAGGNLTKILSFARGNRAEHSLLDAVSATSRVMPALLVGDPPSPIDRSAFSPVALALTILLVAGVVVAIGIAWRRGDAFAVSLGVSCLAGAAFSVMTLAATRGPLFTYVARWIGMLGLAACVTIARAAALVLVDRRASVLPGLSRLCRAAALSGVVALGALSVWASAAPDSYGEAAMPTRSRRVQTLATQVAEAATRHGFRRPLLRVAAAASRPIALGLILALDKQGLRPAVEPFGPFRLGGRFAPTGDEDAVLTMDAASRPAPSEASQVVARVGATVVFLSARP